ncbi:MAG: hypothetical protein D6685_15305 [Bacteroidetes bacterium]|nr:MAG: hypothetical protein D6685_15305 [Bacteroidota bacterium]
MMRLHRWLVMFGIALWPLGGTALAQVVRPPELQQQYYRAEAAWRSGSSVLEAKARVDRVLREIPDDAAARKLRAQVLLAMQRPAEALPDARRAAELDPSDGEALLILSEAARLSGDTTLARLALDQAADHILDDAALHLRLSWNALELGLLDRAESFARIALALDGEAAAAYYHLARVFMRQHRPDEAATILRQGFDRALLDPAALRDDPVLKPLVQHPALRGHVD